jgi:predicted RecB family nuclease
MNPALLLTEEIFAAFLKCRYKAYLKLRGADGEKSDYERSQAGLAAEYRTLATENLLRRHEGTAVIESPSSLPAAIRAGAAIIFAVTADDAGESCHLDALERATPAAAYGPVLFVRREKVTAADRLLLAFGATILARIQEVPPRVGRIVHGKGFKHSRVELVSLSAIVRDTVGEIRALNEAAKAPPLLLNRHCAECEFRRQCRAAAVEKDDLSLLGGLSPKAVKNLNAKGIFTVTQYSYTFRPGRMKRLAGKKHDHSLQALAVREAMVYVAKRSELPEAKSMLYLDVEGLPDEGFYYLIGLTVSEGGSLRHLCFWADGEAEEASIWASFLAAVGAIEEFVLFHYGSYESYFLDRMEARHGGDPVLLAKLKSQCVNVLSLIHSRVYFPVHSNDLKSVAGCLGFRWSAPEASGLQSIVWRHGWAASREEAIKQQLLVYNQEDCSALERVVEMLRSVGDERRQTGDETGPRVAAVEEVGGMNLRKFGKAKLFLPEFARITKCAYFDYQRDKVLCRTNPAVRKSIAREQRRKRQVWKVNREVECGPLVVCPHCGSNCLGPHSPYEKLVIDLKAFRGGIKRWVTRYKVKRYRCRQCHHISLPDDYRAVSSHKYGWGLCSWGVYSSISLRQTDDAVMDAVGDLFGIYLSSRFASKLRQRAADYYLGSYESLLTSLRNGRLVHADETMARIKTSSSDGYVWVFANPETAVYVYAPTRDGDTVRETLAGFRGVLVSDFYAAYDSLDCPQQKCLIHLVRDFNDDILKHPFDEELKQMASRFAVLLQAIVGTIDRYGLTKHHLGKHKKDVDRYYATEAAVVYGSETAQHYQKRVVKYRDKLFTFLDHDGVPWNNNNAENAIKRFASRRRLMGAAFSESGIRAYLLLLSIYQTLRYRNLSFWQFLLSRERDIEAFTTGRR